MQLWDHWPPLLFSANVTPSNSTGCSFCWYCFTSTETIRTIRDGSPRRPPPLSHSSWTLWPPLPVSGTIYCPSFQFPLPCWRPPPPPPPTVCCTWTGLRSQQAGTGLRSHSTQGLDSDHIAHGDWTQITQPAETGLRSQPTRTGLRSHSTQGLDSDHIAYMDWTQIT